MIHNPCHNIPRVGFDPFNVRWLGTLGMNYPKIDEFTSYKQISIFMTDHVFLPFYPVMHVFVKQWWKNLQKIVLEEEVCQVKRLLSENLSVKSNFFMQIKY